ncbi:MAG: Alkyl hydroperoxide reductase/ Thiol specific antioxidant/ Mal allergen [Microgenomates group bacterium GW2011_GWC1_43_13]|uniref:thioredoxin-dependent peroxiredoxin n=2 Tax=Candidatus Woeseibacteriota TaxID=1752722 RepID=A0A1F8DL82_9BACT|nr:MAG: Alkyl hydroperoxide reductase/ Thiol specific antioxidant/ Mal allergen [Microgenomates group bacterium GW2011_GWC1_43_13]KKT33598.1 MAG: Peroxiredoxin bcp [Candidatus Woesebacteria bacterium GW2011_GWB1_44_11]OGM76294.1 MAG: thiol peroxidase [Candidatus Woesebacteria bacterium RIFOXYA1_FULL_43_16]OGM81851.1 MAG: thiol peroxidase [Candidatus Woesebacteria bacterium RIFOXYB1_FULL_42_36]OGM83836.1 MAG: thiol peroxidase [Candidatus Woesebacteria bacterium RIFOXYC1_FULL_43_18]OGM88545.1 MA
MQARDFRLPDQNGKIHRLSDYKGKWIILYFYPKDNTPGCTKEACNFRDSIDKFQKLGAVILGVSVDSVASHKKFAEKYRLNYPILSNESKDVIKEYKSWGIKKFMGREFEGTIRNTYLIDPKGKVKKFYEKVNPLSHSEQIIKDLISQEK